MPADCPVMRETFKINETAESGCIEPEERIVMSYRKRFTALLLFLGAGGVVAEELPMALDSADEQYLSDNPVLPAIAAPVRSDLEVLLGGSYLYDSNITQTADGEGGTVGVTDFGASYVFGNEDARGAHFGLSYLGQAFFYEDAQSRAGRDPLEHRLQGVAGLTGGRTRLRLDTSLHINNGNGISLERADRETRYASGIDYTVDVTVVRDLPHGTLEFGVGTDIHDFDGGNGLNDGESYYGDLAWFYQPGFAPKSAFGLGVRAGQEDVDANGSQDFVTPSLRWRYQVSGKTSLETSTGYEFRSIEGSDDQGAFVYKVGAEWAATAKTSLGIASYRDVQPSYAASGQNYTAHGVGLTLQQQLPARFSLASTIGYEVADYSSTVRGVVANREDDYFKADVTLGREISLWGRLDGSIDLFYNFSQDSSNLDLVEFDRHVVGIRLGFKF